MLRRTAVLVAVLLAAVTACGGSGTPPHAATSPASPPPPTRTQPIKAGPPLAVATSSDAKAAVKDGRLTRTLLLDGGKLRLDPTSDTPRLSEDRAVHLWAAGSMPGSFSEADEPVAVLARVTLQVPVTSPDLTVRPATMPRFVGRDAWVMLWQNGPHSCPALPVRTDAPTGGPEPQPVEIIAADGSNDGVSYQTRGSFCEQPTQGPTATPATYQESLPWTLAKNTPTTLTLAFTVPPCGQQTGLAGPNGQTFTIWVGATVAMGAGPCLGAKPGPATLSIGRNTQNNPTHGATGLLVSRSSDDYKNLTYFDGQTRSLPVSQ